MKMFLNVFFESVKEGNKIRLRVLPDQPAPRLYISFSHEERIKFPIGTIYKADLQLVEIEGKKPYYVLRFGGPLLAALEYYDHNKRLQQQAQPAEDPLRELSSS